ncbi:electron transport complex subunit RsxG [Marinobacterium sp. xm-d-530]|uniref:electron transport complex subunit RsxG n=1 Tax=Marinobacterium sp. xm-d-530 TaxID=2497747 RepID=UPI001569C3E3|nr:electron transport complex subunit RsxG [Marinobacterium sp. xm-d-530]NRQ01542.1 Electron transport complex protein RnfG [Marinobacterium sp. xm-d-530]
MEINENPTTTQSISKSAVGIGLFAVLSAAVIAITQVTTVDRIDANVREAESKALYEIFPASIDEQLYDHRIELDAGQLNVETGITGYQAIQNNQVVGVILPVTSSQGYSGDIDLIVGINADSSIAGVRVISHKETPGLGDKIDRAKSDWIESFRGTRRQGQDDSNWAVKKDGGQFDQFTGATITPRAVVKATSVALDYFESHKNLLLSPANREKSYAE